MQGAKQSGLPDRANAEPRAARPKGKRPAIHLTKSQSQQLKPPQSGQANLQYIRHKHFFVLLATRGDHRFFQDEVRQIRDIRRGPLLYKGYSISYRPGGRTRKGEKDPHWHARVQIDQQKYRELKSWFESIVTRSTEQYLTEALSNIPWQEYAPLRRQKLNVLRAMNMKRRENGLSTALPPLLNLRRRIDRPFFTGLG